MEPWWKIPIPSVSPCFFFHLFQVVANLRRYSRLSRLERPRLVMELEPANLARWTRHMVCGQGWDWEARSSA